jgi:hypothetical protein
MNINIKILGLCIAIAIVGLSIENALTGHGIKGNMDLNPEVLAAGSNSGSGSGSGPGSGSGTDSRTDLYKKIWDIGESKVGEWYFPDYANNPKKMCKDKVTVSKLSCDPGGTQSCKPATVTEINTTCIEYD